MVGVIVKSVRKINFVVILAMYVSSSCCMNLGLIAGDLKRLSPLVIKKYSQNSPVFINIKSENQPLKGFLHRIPAKSPPVKRSEPKLKSSRKFPRSIFAIPKLPLVPYIIPLIPRTPVLPFFPSWLPPPTSIPLPMEPPMLKINHLLSWQKRNTQILGKLLELKHRGSLSTSEYIRFKNLLLK